MPPSVFWSSSYSTSLRTVVKYLTYFSFIIQSINLTNPIQPTYSDKLNISKSPYSCINSLLYRFLQFSFTLIPPNFLLKIFLSKLATRLAMSLLNVLDSGPHIVIGLIKVFQIIIFSALRIY